MYNFPVDLSIFPVFVNVPIGENMIEFVTLGNVSIGENMIEFPVGANVLYLKSVTDELELSLLKKYSTLDQFTNQEMETMLKYFINIVTKPEFIANNTDTISILLKMNGITVKDSNFVLMEEWIPYIKKETWECVVLSLLKNRCITIIEDINFNINIPIYLGAWKTDVGEVEHSLLSSFRNALMFTLIGFIYGDARSLYSSFDDYFTHEFSKRIRLIHSIWISKKADELVRYIPIFDNFYNLKGIKKHELTKMLSLILNNNQISSDDKEMITSTLISGAEKFHKNIDAEGLELEKSLIKPVVNYFAELTEAFKDLEAAELLESGKLFKQSVNRSYYAMMHALKALLEKKSMLSYWSPNKLNVSEEHKSLELKLRKLVNRKILDAKYLDHFIFVKKYRWIADYNASQIRQSLCKDCLNKANQFLSEIKRITS